MSSFISSQLPHGTCAYFRFNQNDSVTFSIGKSRCAPSNLKMLIILKLELQAAVIATRLKCKILEQFSIGVSKIFFWTDYQAVYPSYVIYCVNEINPIQKYLIPGRLNIADRWRRPLTFRDLISDYNYLKGPERHFYWRNWNQSNLFIKRFHRMP